MDIGRVLARSLEVSWRYKILWVFGFLLALTGGGSGNWFNYSLNNNNFGSRPTPSGRPFTPPQFQPAFLIAALAFAACLAVLFLILVLYFRFVARGALVASVRDLEKGSGPALGSAWREGQRYYGRLLGLGFLFNIPLALFTSIGLLIAFLPFIGTILAIISRDGGSPLTSTETAPFMTGIVGFLALLCCAVLCIVLVNLILHPVYEFAVRSIVLEDSGVFEGLARGYHRLRENLGPVALLYLMLIGARIGWSIARTIVVLPFTLILLAFIGAVSAIQSTTLIVLAALGMGLPFVLAIAFLEGLFQVFESNAWTEGYLALLAPASLPPPPMPVPAPVTSA